mgnify:CR=1 FL=1
MSDSIEIDKVIKSVTQVVGVVESIGALVQGMRSIGISIPNRDGFLEISISNEAVAHYPVGKRLYIGVTLISADDARDANGEPVERIMDADVLTVADDPSDVVDVEADGFMLYAPSLEIGKSVSSLDIVRGKDNGDAR